MVQPHDVISIDPIIFIHWGPLDQVYYKYHLGVLWGEGVWLQGEHDPAVCEENIAVL